MGIGTKIAGGMFVVAALFAISTAFGSWYTIDQTERGVILRNGAVVGTAEPGLSFKLPWIDSVREISVASHARRYESMEAFSSDRQPVVMTVSVNFHIPPDQVKEVYTQYQTSDNLISRLVDPRVMEEVKTTFGQYTVVQAIQNRAQLNADIVKSIQAAVQGPIVIESVQLENMTIPQPILEAVQAQQVAEVEVQKLNQNAKREEVQAKITVIQATAKADSVRAAAKADADAIILRGEAEATAIRVKAEALASNVNLVTLTAAERWNGQLPTTMVPGSAVPFINVGQGTAAQPAQ